MSLRLFAALAAFASIALPPAATAQTVVLPRVANVGGSTSPSQASVLIDASGVEKGTSLNPFKTSNAPAPSTVSISSSGTIAAAGGTAAISMTAVTRVEVINPSTAPLWASFGTPAVNGAGSFKIVADGSYVAHNVTGVLTLLATSSGQSYTVNRFAY